MCRSPLLTGGLHRLCNKAAHLVRCGFLHGGGGVGVGAQGEAGVVVAQHGGDGLDVYAVLEGQGGEGVAEIRESRA